MVKSRLIEALRNLTRTKKRGRQLHHIVSSELCDDIIKRLGKSLDQYKGGTIIDVNPGVGLFSQKLHEHLKPRLHVLCDDQWDRHAEFLEPLLKQPGTKYVRRDQWDNWNPQRLVTDGLLSDADIDQENATIQIVNATSRKLVTQSANFKNSDIWAARFARRCRSQEGFLARGPTRMLMWCLDSEKKTLIPPTINKRTKVAVFLESFCNVSEVAGFPFQLTKGNNTFRDPALEAESARRVQQRMRDNDISIPPARHFPTDSSNEANSKPLPGPSRLWHDELRLLQSRFASGTLSKYVDDPPKAIDLLAEKGVKKLNKQYTPEYERADSLRRIYRSQATNLKSVEPLIQEQQALDDLDLNSYSSDLTPASRAALLADYDTRSAALKRTIDTLPHVKRTRFLLTSDSHRAMYTVTGNPILHWDRRPYEPLLAKEQEFYPEAEVTLLDFHSHNHLPEPLTDSQATHFESIVAALTSPSAMNSDLSVLNHVAPGAFDSLVPKIPELTDIRQGGRRDLQMLRNRLLTPKMLWQLAVHWDKWPFRPEQFNDSP